MFDSNAELPESYAASKVPVERAYQFETLNVDGYECPWCGGTDRERLYAIYLKERAATYAGSKIKLLDIAPGGRLRHWLQNEKWVDYRSADLYREDVDDRIDVQNMSLYADASFDIVICSHVLEHVRDDRVAMKEIYRILVPNGWAIIMVPIPIDQTITDEDPEVTDPVERVRRFDQVDHLRRYAGADFVARLAETGRTVIRLTSDHFGQEEFKKRGIQQRSVLYVLKKSVSLESSA